MSRPVISDLVADGGDWRVSLATVVGRFYAGEVSRDMESRTTLEADLPGDGGLLGVRDGPVEAGDGRFYRLRVRP